MTKLDYKAGVFVLGNVEEENIDPSVDQQTFDDINLLHSRSEVIEHIEYLIKEKKCSIHDIEIFQKVDLNGMLTVSLNI